MQLVLKAALLGGPESSLYHDYARGQTGSLWLRPFKPSSMPMTIVSRSVADHDKVMDFLDLHHAVGDEAVVSSASRIHALAMA